MRWHRVAVVVALLCTSGCGFAFADKPAAVPVATPAPAYEPVELEPALSAGLVEVGFRSMGHASGASIIMRVANLSGRPLEVQVRRGLVLGGAPGVQTMALDRVLGTSMDNGHIAVETDRVLLEAGAARAYVVSAYCVNAALPDPTYDVHFSIVGRHAEAQRILDAAARGLATGDGATVPAIQLAIWSVTNDIAVTDVAGRLTFMPEDLAQARLLLERAGIDPAQRKLFAV